MEPKKEMRNLQYHFTATELHDLSLELAQKTQDLTEKEDEKKAAMKVFNDCIKDIKAETNRLSHLVSDGFEYRDVDVEIHWHKPEPGRKTIIRLDTHKVVSVQDMLPQDHDLFNQNLTNFDPMAD